MHALSMIQTRDPRNREAAVLHGHRNRLTRSLILFSHNPANVLSTGDWTTFGQTLNISYVFFWVFPRRLIVVCRRFGTLYRFHLQGLDVKSAYNNQTPGKNPKEYIIDSKHGESLKSRIEYQLYCVSNHLLRIASSVTMLLTSSLCCQSIAEPTLLQAALSIIWPLQLSLDIWPEVTR